MGNATNKAKENMLSEGKGRKEKAELEVINNEKVPTASNI